MNRLDWKRRIGHWVGRLTASEQRTVILLYHSVGEGPLAVSEATFREQIGWLSERASIVPLAVALAAKPATGIQVVITFDDGYASLHDRAAPILADYGATATAYVNTGWIGDTARKSSEASLGHYPNEFFMNWGEAEVLANAGWNFGSHGVGHLDLTQQDIASVERELTESKGEIQSRLGRPCEHFAYTWGRFTPALASEVRRAGYQSAASCLHGPVSADSDQFALPRIDVRAEYEMQDFVALVSGRWDYLGYKQRLARTLA